MKRISLMVKQDIKINTFFHGEEKSKICSSKVENDIMPQLLQSGQ